MEEKLNQDFVVALTASVVLALAPRFDRIDARFDKIEARLDAVEVRLDVIEAKLGVHDQKFKGLEEDASDVMEAVHDLAGQFQMYAEKSDKRVLALEVRAGVV